MFDKTIICLSFDDGRKDFYDYAFPILEKYNLVASLNVTTGYVDDSFKPNWETSYGSVSKEELKELKDYGIEIAYHGDQHITEEKDFKNSINKLNKWNLKENKMGFAVPGSYLENINIKKFTKFLKNNSVIYMRVDNDKKCNKFYNKVFRKLYNLTNTYLFYKLYNQNNSKKNINDWYNLSSIIVFKKDNSFCLNKYIDSQIKRKSLNIFMFHGILPNNHKCYGKDEYAWDTESFDNFCSHLSKLSTENKIKVKTLISIAKKES